MTDPDGAPFSERTVHDSLGTTTEFFSGYTFGELVVLAAPTCLLLLSLGLPVTPSWLVPYAIGGWAAASLSVLGIARLTPDHLLLHEWLLARAAWALRSTDAGHGDSDADTVWNPRIEQIHPFAVERIDGAYLGAVRIEPGNLALEDGDAWERAVDSFASFATNTLEFQTQVYVTTRTRDHRDFVADHVERLTDSDMERRPVLRAVLEHFVDAHTTETGEITAGDDRIREFYLIVPVTDEEIEGSERDGLVGALSGVPILDDLWGGLGGEVPDGDRHERKRDQLDERLGQLRRNASDVYRVSATPVSSLELARVIKEYWTCGRETYGDLESAVRTFPIVSHGIAEGREGSPERRGLGDATSPESGDGSRRGDAGAPATADATSPEFRRLPRQHKGLLAPSSIDWHPSRAVVDGETHVRTYWIEHFPEEPGDGFLESLLLRTDLETDVSIHVDPVPTNAATAMFEDWISDLQVTRGETGSQFKREDLQYDIDRAKHIRHLVRANKASFYRVGVFVRLCADDEHTLRRRHRQLVSLLKDTPANCTPKVATRWQEKGLATVAPTARNELGKNRTSMMSDQAVGALFPFSSNYLQMESGIEYGTHAHNGSRVYVDPWDLETGHSELVVGTPGAGKTFGTTMRLLRMMKRRGDTMLVLLDPVGGFRGIAEAIGARTITVSGRTKLNPLEIRKTPPDVLADNPDLDPLAAKKNEVFSILDNFLEFELGADAGVLRYAIDETYRRAGVTEDVATHTAGNSPTMSDLLALLADISEHPHDHPVARSATARTRASEHADRLALALQPFSANGAHSNLSQPSEVDVLAGEADAVYVDLSQVEASGGGMEQQVFLMQLLIATIYQQTKRTDRKVELVIDEAHYLLEYQANLEFLNQVFRHQRHVGLRLVLLSQTLSEFYETKKAEEIAGMCPIKVIHRLPELDEETAETVGLTEQQQWFVRNADSGKAHSDYAQALVRVEEVGDYPLHISADELEKRVIRYDRDDRQYLRRLVDGDPEEFAAFATVLEREGAAGRLRAEYDLAPAVARAIVAADVHARDMIDLLVDHVRTRLEGDGATVAGSDSPTVAAESPPDQDRLALDRSDGGGPTPGGDAGE